MAWILWNLLYKYGIWAILQKEIEFKARENYGLVMDIHPIKTEAEYERTLVKIKSLWSAKENIKEGDIQPINIIQFFLNSRKKILDFCLLLS